MTLTLDDAVRFWRAGLILAFAIIGLACLRDVGKEHGYGLGLLVFGIYLAAVWTALRP